VVIVPSSPSPKVLRIAGWCGIVFSVLSLIVAPLVASPSNLDPPVVGASAEVFANWYAQHRAGFLIGNYLGIASFGPGLVQLAVLAARIRSHEEGESRWLGSLVLATGTFTYTVFACSLVVFQAMPFLTAEAAAPATLALGTLSAMWFSLDGLAALPLIFAVGFATRETGALPRWFGHASWIVGAFAAAMSLGALFSEPAWIVAGGPATLVGFLAFFIWTLALGVIFLRLAAKVPSS
jgi:hypothetical protein